MIGHGGLVGVQHERSSTHGHEVSATEASYRVVCSVSLERTISKDVPETMSAQYTWLATAADRRRTRHNPTG